MIVVYAWIALAILGIWLAYRNAIEATNDFRALGGKTNGRRTIAVGNLRREIVRGLIHLDFLVVGVLVILDFRVFSAPGLILASAGMVLNSFLDRRDRLYLMENGMQARDQHGRFKAE